MAIVDQIEEVTLSDAKVSKFEGTESTMNCSGRLPKEGGIVPLPLVIGVTGHRDLREEDRAPLEGRVRQVFAEFQRRYPSTPLLLLSPLAEGADRLVARAALEKGARLIVPLPMPQTLYEEDFQTRASREEFHKLLQQAESWFELPLLNGAREKEVRQQGPARDRQYAQVVSLYRPPQPDSHRVVGWYEHRSGRRHIADRPIPVAGCARNLRATT